MRRRRIFASRTKKTIEIIAGLSILLVGAVAGVTMFLESNDTAQAATEERQATIVQNEQTNTRRQEISITPNNSASTQRLENQQRERTTAEVATSDRTAESTQTAVDETNLQNGTTLVEEANNPINTSIPVDETNNPVSTSIPVESTSTEQPVESTIREVETQPTEFISYRDRIVAEDILVGWTSTNLPVIAEDVAEKDIYRPILEVEKNSYTESDMLTEDGELVVPNEAKYNTISAGELIAYEIKVKNSGNLDAKDVDVSSIVPDGTTFILAGQDGEETDGIITWRADIPKQSALTFGFLVQVNDDADGTIDSIATVEGKKANTNKNTLITINKTAQIYRNGKQIPNVANIGDKIKYTVSIKNTGDIDGITNIIDSIPKNTKLVSDILLDGKKIDEETMSEGTDITIKAGKETELAFTVEIEKIDGEIENTAIVGKKTLVDSIKTANLEISNKVSKSENGEFVKDVILAAGETAYFKIEMKNTGSENLALDIEDVLDDNIIDLYDDNKAIEETFYLSAGVSKVLTATYTMTQEGIDNKKPLKNTIAISNMYIPNISNSVMVTPKDEKPSISIEKIATAITKTGTSIEKAITENTTARPGDIVTYEITVKNDGKLTLRNIEVTDTLDITNDGNKIAANNPLDVITKLAPNEEKTYTVQYKVTQKDIDDNEPIKNVAKATDGNVLDEDNADKEIPINPDVEVTITKNWEDDSNKVGARPEDITIGLSDGLQIVKDVVLKPEQAGDNTWTSTIKGLPKYDENKKEITYKAVEENVPEHYEKSEDGLTITNTIDYSSFKKDIEVTNIWEDINDKVGVRPDKITIGISNGSQVIEEVILKAAKTGDNIWKTTIRGLLKYNNNGDEIEYKAIEENVPAHYEKNEDDLTITNTIKYSTFEKSVSVTKEWIDNDNITKNRPENVVLTVKSSSTDQEDVDLTLSGEGNIWTATANKVRLYDDNGDEITYTAIEKEVPKYYEKEENKLKVTNTINYSKIKQTITLYKLWVDNGNAANVRPTKVTFTLTSSNSTLQPATVVEVTGDPNVTTWTADASGVRKYDDNGIEITYSVSENDDLEYYKKAVLDNVTISNSIIYSKLKMDVEVTKIWEDVNNIAGVRPEDDGIMLTLRSSSNVQGNVNLILTKNNVSNEDANKWVAVARGVRMYDNSGNKITYSIIERDVPSHYEMEQIDTYTIKNRIKYGEIKRNISASMIWEDMENIDGKRPDSVSISLKNGDTNIGTVTLSNENGWSHTFTDIFRFLENGTEIEYTVVENNMPEDYTAEITGNMTDGFIITNKYTH